MSMDKAYRKSRIYLHKLYISEGSVWLDKKNFFNLIRNKKFCGRGHIFTQFNFSPQLFQ